MTRFWMGSAAAVMAVSIAGVNAQSTGSQTPQTQTPQTSASQQAMGETTTLKGCVYKEDAIPGRTPNVAERAGVMEDYILVVSDKSASASATGTGTSGTATGSQTATGTSGAASMHKAFKLENIADERLSAVVGKMVEVTGRIDAEAGDKARTGTATGTSGTTPDRSVGPDQIELAEFEVTNLKEVEGTCPATPQIKK
jgi:hypothetical protein